MTGPDPAGPTLDAAPTRSAARHALAAAFAQAGLDEPDADARAVLQYALRIDRARLATTGDERLDAAERQTIARLAARRLRHEPVAHIVGQKEFWGLSLCVSPATLIPRPDTETVVEAVLAAVDTAGTRTAPLRILDLGTGSGAILLALLGELPNASGVGTDISQDALEIAQRNAGRLGLAARAAFLVCDFGMALRARFDLIVANPPYIATAEIAALAPDVRDHEPPAALDGGADGLAAYRSLAQQCPRLMGENGALAVEIGRGQAAVVAGIFSAAGLHPNGHPRRDLAGIERALVFRHSAA